MRGLKLVLAEQERLLKVSHPARGAWIETFLSTSEKPKRVGRTPPGVRGLKRVNEQVDFFFVRRTPPGVRGLKHALTVRLTDFDNRRTPPGVRGLKQVSH